MNTPYLIIATDIPQLPNSLLMGHLPYIASGFKKLGDSLHHVGMRFLLSKYSY